MWSISRLMVWLKVWYQHSRYFRKKGIRTSPEELFDAHLLAQLRAWRKDGEEIVLCGDFNQDIYTSDFAEALRGEDIQLEEQYRELTGQEAPPSHFTGSLPGPNWGPVRVVTRRGRWESFWARWPRQP